MNEIDPYHIHETIARIEAGIEKPFASFEKLAESVAALMGKDGIEAEKCLSRIAAAYEATGNQRVKLALENCFLFQLGNRIFQRTDRQRLLEMLPRNLHDMLMRQMLAPGP